MDKKILEELKSMTREERMIYFEKNVKGKLSVADLDNVNGGNGADNENPNSEGVWGGNYYTSWGYVCNGNHSCG